MKTNLLDPLAGGVTASGMQHRRPAKPRQKKQQRTVVNPTDDLFEAIVQHSDDAIIGKTLSGIVTSWNHGAEIIFGYTEKEMIGQPMLRLFPTERQDEAYDILEKIIAGERVTHFETVRIHKNGLPIIVSVTISPVRNRDGIIVGTSTIARDVSDKVQLENAAERFRALVDCSDDAMITKDLHGCINSWNKGAQSIFGYSAEEMIGEPMLRLFPKDRMDEEKVILSKILAGEKVDHVETVRIRKDGHEIHVSVTISPILDHDGNIIGESNISRDITLLHQQQEKLEHIAHYDSLTDLPNRLLLTDRLGQTMALSRRTHQQLAVLYLDLDGFKQINDMHGHDIGDALLIALSRRVTRSLREADTLARIGGDEFVAVLVDVKDPEKLKRILGRILYTFAEPVFIDGKRLEVSASIGVTTYPHDDVTEDMLMRHADLAMYEAKQAGKNRYHIFDAFREVEDKSRHAYARRVGEALERNEFLLHYQPKINMKTNEVIGVEALIRWQHPERGLLSPPAFLPLIEGHALNEDIGLWVIGRALAQMETWREQGIRMAVSVNMVPDQLQNELFPTILGNMLARYPGLDPADLELEIVETSALHDIDAISRAMQACRKLGVQFSIDDFGTGYSSLTYLKWLPANTLKIDQSFVRDMLSDHEDIAIICGVIGLATAFDRKVIAEGVESEVHGEKLLELGCELAQGYGISRPMSGARLRQWLAAWNEHPQWL